ncbi:MAG: hypothetical protein MJZ22_04720, partial [Candidatus Saccharibacteria bacterium]|nr:hypothetical protein [Candidatus Saccharibacteria bacterium]
VSFFTSLNKNSARKYRKKKASRTEHALLAWAISELMLRMLEVSKGVKCAINIYVFLHIRATQYAHDTRFPASGVRIFGLKCEIGGHLVFENLSYLISIPCLVYWSPLKIQFSKIWLRLFALVRHSKWQIPPVFATFHSCHRSVSLKFS